jgi:predicted nucleic acid-binding protein
MRVFLDANVLFSTSLLTRGIASTLLRVGRTGGCPLLASQLAFEEAERNLVRKAPGALERFSSVRQAVQVVVEPPVDLSLWAEAQGLPAKDAPILAAAVNAQADLLVTGDRRHFGPLFGRVLRGVRILSLAEGLAAVLAEADRKSH